MEQLEIRIAKDFSKTPGARLMASGDYSAELFRKTILFPKMKEAIEKNIPLVVYLDGVAGYAASFLEEAFGGLIRVHKIPYEKTQSLLKLVSKDCENWIEEAEGFMEDAHEHSISRKRA